MPKWLKIVGVWVVGIAGLVSTWWTWQSLQEKELTCYIMSKRQLLTGDPDNVAEGLKVLFREQEVRSPWATTIGIENSGNVPISASDVETPVSLDLGQVSVLSSDVQRTSPTGIDANVEHSGNKVTIRHGLLNAEDVLFINLILDGEPNIRLAGGRISGIKEPRLVDVSEGLGAATEPYYSFPRIISMVVAALFSMAIVAIAFQVFRWWWRIVGVDFFSFHPNWDEVLNKTQTLLEGKTGSYTIPGSEMKFRVVSEMLERPELIEKLLAQPHHIEPIEKSGLTVNEIRDDVMTTIRDAIRQKAYLIFLSDFRVSRAIGEKLKEIVKLPADSVSDYMNRVRQFLESSKKEELFWDVPTSIGDIVQRSLIRLIVVLVGMGILVASAFFLWRGIL